MLFLHNENSHHTMSNHSSEHMHVSIEVPVSEKVPSIEGMVTQDLSGSWLLKIQTENFTFTPEKIGSKEVSYNEGHAHLFMNGKKINRLYGHYYNLDYLKEGKYEIKVTLHANNHELLTHEGKELAFHQVIEVSASK